MITEKQANRIMDQLDTLLSKITLLDNSVAKLNKYVNALTDKTIVISDVDKKIREIKNTVESLKDEQEA